MNIENNSGRKEEGEKSPAELELSKLSDQLSQLEIVRGSMRTETSVVHEAGSRVVTTDAEKREVSNKIADSVAESGGVLTEEDKEDLRKADESHEEALKFKDDMNALPSVAYETHSFQNNWDALPEALKDKLASLGIDHAYIDKNKAQGVDGQGIDDALATRAMEIRDQMREVKLEIPGGKEEMIGEALVKSNAFSKENFQPFAYSVGQLFESPESPDLAPAFDKMKELFAKGNLRQYPLEVQKGIAASLTRQAFLENARSAESGLDFRNVSEEFGKMLEQGK